jgi:O-antigen ligase
MSFVFLLLYITAIYIRPQEWVPAIYGWPLINMLAIATALFLACDIARNQSMRIKESATMLLIAFLGCVAMSHLVHIKPYFGGAFDSFLKFGTNVAMFLLFVNVLTSTKKIRISIWLIIILTVILAVQGIYQYEHGFGWAGQLLVQAEEGVSIGRITWVGIFNDPNDLALAFVMVIGFLLAFLFGRSKIFFKIVSIPFLAVLLYSLYLTNSRGGYLALIATVAYYFLRKMKRKWLALIIGLVMVVAVLAFSPSRMTDISAGEDSARGRIEAWYEGFQMLKSAPLFGVGYKMFTDYHPLTAHNSYILVAAEEGLVGLFVWIALIYICFKGLDKLSKQDVHNSQFMARELGPYVLGLEVGLVGFLCAAFFLSRAYIEPLYIMLALGCAFAFTMLKKEDYRFSTQDAGWSGALAVGILAAAWVTTKISLKILS